MAQTYTKRSVFPISTDDLMKIVTNAEFQETQRKGDEAVTDAKFVEIKRTDDELIFELRATEYERGIKGMNKKKTIQSVTRVEWDLKKRVGTWSYSAPVSDRFVLGGKHKVEPAGDQARLISETNVEVKIPLVGKKIEKLVIQGMEKGREKYDILVREFIKKLL